MSQPATALSNNSSQHSQTRKPCSNIFCEAHSLTFKVGNGKSRDNLSTFESIVKTQLNTTQDELNTVVTWNLLPLGFVLVKDFLSSCQDDSRISVYPLTFHVR